ncbi:10247_t:CDS:2, partial [Acaulospora morrowiae]
NLKAEVKNKAPSFLKAYKKLSQNEESQDIKYAEVSLLVNFRIGKTTEKFARGSENQDS